MITIPDPKNATLVWLAYSEVEWTPAVLAKHEDKDWRKKHMQAIDVAMILKGQVQPGVKSLKKLGKTVSEFAFDEAGKAKHDFLDNNAFYFNAKKNSTQKTIEVADQLRPGKGVMVALHDPVGLMQELKLHTNLLLAKKLEYANEEDREYARKVAVSARIAQLHDAIVLNAQHDLISNVEAQADSFKTLNQYANDRSGGGMLDLTDYNALATPSQADIENYQRNTWKKYTHNAQTGKARFDSEEVKTFMEKHEAMMEDFYQTKIKTLAELHVAWFKHPHLKNYYACNFCMVDEKSGAAMTQSVVALTSYTEGMRACFKAYAEELGKNKADQDNILLRALVFNNDELAKQVEGALAFDDRTVPWDPLFGSLEKFVKIIGEELANLPTILMRNMAGPLSKVFDTFVSGTSSFAFTALGMHSKMGWERISFTGTQLEVRKFISRSIIKAGDTELSNMQLNVLVQREMKVARIYKENLNGQYTFNWVVMRKKGTTQLSTPANLAKQAGQATAAAAKSNLARTGIWLSESTAPTLQGVKSLVSSDVRINVITGLLQFWCLTKTIGDYNKALLADRPEAGWRMAAGLLSVTGTTLEGLGNLLDRAMSQLSKAFIPTKFLDGLKLFGKALGFIGGSIMAVWDYMKGKEEAEKGNTKTAWLFRASAGFGLAVSICMTFSKGILRGLIALGMAEAAAAALLMGVTIGLVIIFIGISIWLDRVKDNAIQSWLENCVFGVNKSAYSGKPALEMQEYVNAIS